MGGADLFEHCGPEHGFGGGIVRGGFGSIESPSRLMAGRSDGCSQPAWAVEVDNEPIARSVNNAPAQGTSDRRARTLRMIHL